VHCSAGAGSQQPAPRPARALKALPKGLGAAAALLAARPALAAEPFGSDGIGGSSIELPSLPALPAVELPSVDVSALGLDSIDPLYVAAGAALVAIPLGLGALLGGGNAPRAKAVPAATAVEALAADPGCLLVDIRSKAEAAEVGSPSLKGVSKRAPAAVPFIAVSKEGDVIVDVAFGEKVAKLKGVDDLSKPLILIDTDGSLSPAAAKIVLKELPDKSVYFITGGTDAWQEAGFPWKEPLRFALPDFSNIDLSNIDLTAGINTVVGGAKALADDFAEAPSVTKGILAAGAVAGASVLLFSQAELLFEVAGLFAAGQFLFKMLFAEEREKALTEIKKVAEQVDIEDLPEDLGKIATTLLEDKTGTQVIGREGAAAGAADSAAAASASSTPAPGAAAPPTPVPVTPAPAASAASGSGASASASAPVEPVPSAAKSE
jgi:rhodanese-related sulfurtransferase